MLIVLARRKLFCGWREQGTAFLIQGRIPTCGSALGCPFPKHLLCAQPPCQVSTQGSSRDCRGRLARRCQTGSSGLTHRLSRSQSPLLS